MDNRRKREGERERERERESYLVYVHYHFISNGVFMPESGERGMLSER